ncbi:formimidoylglutamase [Halomonas llamarensis]|uniref:Formimidoylglutamase n=1 Tax=Halomonas llamarensis TaxID=2945104 RepID=A0ABT0SSH7_9GAMM|nr:formimidoylglutamase [Halomonas llamarensis]MCL7930591.1 formimidoylglutamase [Halomonas llamarensis]
MANNTVTNTNATDTALDMSVWAGRTDPEPNSERWHQKIQPLSQTAAPGCALLGFESDAGVARNQGRIGAAKGPAALRKALAPLAWHRTGPAYDAGNVRCEGDALEAAQQKLADQLSALLEAEHFPIVLGGGHEVAYGSWLGLAQHLANKGERAPRIGIINFDAHFDLRDPSHVRSSGTPFTQIADQCAQRGWPFRYACLGVSRAANTRALFHRAAELGVMIREDRDFQPAYLERIQRDLERFMVRCDHLYLSIDLDVLPTGEAPGVSAPAARGVSLSLLEPLIEIIRDSGKLRLADLAELNPDHDIDSRTARTAARLVFQLSQ